MLADPLAPDREQDVNDAVLLELATPDELRCNSKSKAA